MAIKVSIGKLSFGGPFETFIPAQVSENGIELLDIKFSHLATVAGLPFFHRDPFDRLLVAQAIEEQMPIVGADPAFDAYAGQRFW